MKKWIVPAYDRENVMRISRTYDIPLLPSVLLDIKHFENDNQMFEFLSKKINLTDPFLIADMDAAVARINKAIENLEKICIYGDYDADGITSTAVLYSYFDSIGVDVIYYIPDRTSEGYGLNKNAVSYLNDKGVNLIITVDNGISAYYEVEYANSLGMDVIITDHHSVPERMPNAAAIVNPHRSDDESPFKEFSGVGVVFKLIMALEHENLTVQDLLDLYSDICAIGTIADVVSLTGENRILVREGLKRINDNVRPGIFALKGRIRKEGQYLSSTSIAFNFAPKINACGRVGGPETAIRLFLTEDLDEAEDIAKQLIDENDYRKKLESEILEEAVKTIESNPDVKYRRILVVEGENWHQGVIGIVAARIKERYGKPAIVISCSGDEGKGSCRSIEGFNMYDAITHCKELMTAFGGHPMAAGLTIPVRYINEFRDKINIYAEKLTISFFPVLNLSCKITPAATTLNSAVSLNYLEPYGTDNEKPVFGMYEVRLDKIRPIGDGKHMKFTVSKKNSSSQITYFNMPKDEFPYIEGDILNLAVSLETNYFNNRQEVSVLLKDICFSNVDYEAHMKSKQLFEDLMIGKPVTPEMKKELTVTRDDFVLVYNFLKRFEGFKYSADILHYRLNAKNISYGKLLVILEAMKEHKLIKMNTTSSLLNIEMVENPAKVNILSASILADLV